MLYSISVYSRHTLSQHQVTFWKRPDNQGEGQLALLELASLQVIMVFLTKAYVSHLIVGVCVLGPQTT